MRCEGSGRRWRYTGTLPSRGLACATKGRNILIVIIDYGVGNIGSVESMLRKIGAPCAVSTDSASILEADKLILPGVGHFDKAMGELSSRGLIPVLNEAVRERKKPTLGICLGAQLLGRRSEEGSLPGLGWLEMDVIKFDTQQVRVPHMGWSVVTATRPSFVVPEGDVEQRFYFVHSYFMKPDKPELELAQAQYGQAFACAVGQDNVFGVQFHPEKSHRFGLGLLQRFACA